jgi:hypothetical protein
MGTREAIRSITGTVVIEASAVEIDEALLGRDETGMTDWDFEPQQNARLLYRLLTTASVSSGSCVRAAD